MANYLVTDTELTQVANAIRAKARASGSLAFPVGFVNTISGITEKAAATYNVSSSNQTIAANQYLAGAQTIRGVTTENIAAGNIKSGVTVKVGDAGDAARIANVAGTFTSDGNITAGDVLNGKIGYSKGNKIIGNIPSKGAATYNVSSSDQTIAAGQYLSGAQTIRKVTTANLLAANIKKGVTVKVGDVGDDDRIAGVTGTYTSDATAGAAQILNGYTAYVNGNKVTGTYVAPTPPTPTINVRTGYTDIDSSASYDMSGYYAYDIPFSWNDTKKAPYAVDLLVNSTPYVTVPVGKSGNSWYAYFKGYTSEGSVGIRTNKIRVYYQEFYL